MNLIRDLALPPDVASEIEQITATLSADTSCIATGSIVEGFGNANSDIDLYLIDPKRVARQSTSIGLRQSRYVDCEYLTVSYLETLADRMNGHTWTSLPDLTSRDFSRYYRLSIGKPVVVYESVAKLSESFQRSMACLAYSRWALLMAFKHLARASCCLATGLSRQADLLEREAQLWYATSVLAAEGEGYPSLKWVGEKAARRFGRDSPQYRELVDGWLRPAAGITARLAQLRSQVQLPTELMTMLQPRSCHLADRVRHVAGSDTDYLIRAGQSVAQTRGVVSVVSRRLAAGDSWAQATATVAEELSVPVGEVRVGAWMYMVPLRSAGFLSVGVAEGA